ncbi:MAG TPA: hypothetical protein PKA82_07500 [Pyrinomonadaceae bacterium]|mgnify:CR=1 FL=1|nr:hypothetical protein [Pyrinomonadaceae bacterium]
MNQLRTAIALSIILSLLSLTSAFAQTSPKSYAIELVVVRDKKSIETDADMTFGDNTVRVVPDKKSLAAETKEFAYTDIKFADQSYSKKPLFSVGGGVATVVLTSLIIPFIAIPFLFIKKKKHWMTIQTEKEYMVLKLGDRNFRQIAAELETKGVKVSELKEKEK